MPIQPKLVLNRCVERRQGIHIVGTPIAQPGAVVSQREVIFACEPSLIRDGMANRPASMSWNQLGRSVKRGEKGIAILRPSWGSPPFHVRPTLTSRRGTRLSPSFSASAEYMCGKDYLVICGRDCTRSMGPAGRRSERTFDSSSSIIAQFFGPCATLLQGNLSAFLPTKSVV